MMGNEAPNDYAHLSTEEKVALLKAALRKKQQQDDVSPAAAG